MYSETFADNHQRTKRANMDITANKPDLASVVEANERAVRQYKNLLEKLAVLGQMLGSAQDLSTIFGAILQFSNASVPCSALIISLYEKEKGTRRCIYLWYNGREVDISNLEAIPVDSGPVEKAIETGEVSIINNYAEVVSKGPSNFLFGFDGDERKPCSEIIAPMRLMGNTIGVIEVQSYEANAYADEHATAMRLAANLAASSVENLRLLEQERRTQERLRLVQRLESVGRLAGGVAHDFNNMLTAINGYSDLTLRSLKAGDPLRQNIEEIKKAGERSALLTSQLLAFSRKQVLTPKVFDVNRSVDEMTGMLERLIGEDIHLTVNLDPALGFVKADPGQLTQVIMNLAVNARDAMPNGGELKIETSNVYLDEKYTRGHIGSRLGNFVRLSVTDTGMGITEEQQEHVFEPFYTTKETTKSTGLGLATVYGIVKQSDGHIWVDSEVGVGSSFKIYLPRVYEAAPSEKSAASHERTPGGGETLLVVEDEEAVRNLTREILVTSGYDVITAEDGSEAMEILRREGLDIDLLLTDVVMPKMSGLQLAETAAEIRSDIKVLYMSGYADDAIFRKGLIQTERNFIKKPFTNDSLAQKVREMLDS